MNTVKLNTEYAAIHGAYWMIYAIAVTAAGAIVVFLSINRVKAHR